ncbi:MAG: CHC2 zinc finger domain-containing protein [Dehalococcoidia bacterium]
MAHPITEAVLSAGIELRRSGRRLVGRCPFHEDRDPSLVVYPQTQSYFCFGCDAGGDVIDFIGRLDGTAFKETAALLAGNGHARSLPANVVRFPSPRSVRQPDGEEVAVIEAAASLYREQCERSRRARSYLAKRGIDADTATRLRLGYADGGLARHLRDRKLSLDTAHRLGLLTGGGRDTLAGRIVVPDLDAEGRATWLTARSLNDQAPRYLNLRRPSPLLGLARTIDARAIVVTEGPFDWLTACGWGLRTVALLGTHVSREALEALRTFRRVYLALDADGPGRRATSRLVSDLGARAVVVPLPKGMHDLSELGCRRDGRDAFLRSLYEARTRREEPWQRQPGRARRGRAA